MPLKSLHGAAHTMFGCITDFDLHFGDLSFAAAAVDAQSLQLRVIEGGGGIPSLATPLFLTSSSLPEHSLLKGRHHYCSILKLHSCLPYILVSGNSSCLTGPLFHSLNALCRSVTVL